MERPVCREVFCILICPCAGTEPKAWAALLPLNTDCPQLNLSRHHIQVFPLQQQNTANSTDQVRKIISRLSTLLVCGYKPYVAAGCICQHVTFMPSAGVQSSVTCLKSYTYNYHWTFTTMKMLMATQAQQLRLCSLPLETQGSYSLLDFSWLQFFFRWTRRRCCRGNFLSHALCILCWPQAEQAHVFHSTAILLLPSFLWSTVLREHWKWLLLN